jgi:hypothetical protein
VDPVALTIGGTTRFPGAAMMAERTVWFLGASAMAMALEAIREALAWSRWQRRSRMARFLGATVKDGHTSWFSGVATVWRRSGWRRRGLSGVEEGAGNFGSLMVSKSKSSR